MRALVALVALAALAAAQNLPILSVEDPATGEALFVVDAEGYPVRARDPVAALDSALSTFAVAGWATYARDEAGRIASSARRWGLLEATPLRAAPAPLNFTSLFPAIAGEMGDAEPVWGMSRHNLHGRAAFAACWGDKCGAAVLRREEGARLASVEAAWTFARPFAVAAWSIGAVAYSPALGAVVVAGRDTSGTARTPLAFTTTPTGGAVAVPAEVAAVLADAELWSVDVAGGAGATYLHAQGRATGAQGQAAPLTRRYRWGPGAALSGAEAPVASPACEPAASSQASQRAPWCYRVNLLGGALVQWGEGINALGAGYDVPLPCPLAPGGYYAVGDAALGDYLVRFSTGSPAPSSYGPSIAKVRGALYGLCGGGELATFTLP